MHFKVKYVIQLISVNIKNLFLKLTVKSPHGIIPSDCQTSLYIWCLSVIKTTQFYFMKASHISIARGLFQLYLSSILKHSIFSHTQFIEPLLINILLLFVKVVINQSYSIEVIKRLSYIAKIVIKPFWTGI